MKCTEKLKWNWTDWIESAVLNRKRERKTLIQWKFQSESMAAAWCLKNRKEQKQSIILPKTPSAKFIKSDEKKFNQFKKNQFTKKALNDNFPSKNPVRFQELLPLRREIYLRLLNVIHKPNFPLKIVCNETL